MLSLMCNIYKHLGLLAHKTSMSVFISSLDFLSFIGTLFALFFMLKSKKEKKLQIVRIISLVFISIYGIYCAILFLQWIEFADNLEFFEDLSGALLPVFWFLVLFALIDKDKTQIIEDVNERMNLILEGAELGTWDWDIKTGHVIYNERWVTMLGYKPIEIEPNIHVWEKIIHPSDREWVVKTVKDHLAGKTPHYETEHRLICKDGSIIWVHDKGSVLARDKQGNPLRAAGTHLDITKRKKIDEELILKNEEYLVANEELSESMKKIQEINIQLEEAKQKAEESDKLKTAFLANLSHEIRTPMNGIVGFASLLENKDLSSNDKGRYLEVIQKSSKRMLNIIEDLVSIAMLESGQVKINKKPTDINQILLNIYDLYKYEAARKNVRFHVPILLLKKHSITLTDKEKLDRVLSNLVRNAIKYTNEGHIEVHCIHQDNKLLFKIKDTGTGIDPEVHSVIFERFRQASKSAYKVEEGCGLGLSITQGYLYLLDGEIWLKSEVGKGTTFYFTIPYAIAEENITGNKRTDNTLTQDTKEFNSTHLLIAEDDDTSFFLLKTFFAKKNFIIHHAKNGQEAIDLFLKHSIDAILMDIKMPKVDGITAIKVIRENNHQIPIIAQTAYTSESDKQKILQAGATHIVPKPIDCEALFHYLKKIIAQ